MEKNLSTTEYRMTAIHKDIAFASTPDQELLLDLYIPSAIAPPPLVVWIHGGGWRSGCKAKPPIRRLTECGYALASISYRFTDKAIFPAQVHDCKCAIRWLRAHQGHYGYDANWIAVIGCSAGGHLALMLAVRDEGSILEGQLGEHSSESTRIQAVVDFYAPSDFALRGRTQPERVFNEHSASYALLGGLHSGELDPSLVRLASPAFHVSEHSPPLLIFHGTEDEWVLMDQSERMAQAYQELQLPVELAIIHGAGHGGAKFFWGASFDRMLTFLDTSRKQS